MKIKAMLVDDELPIVRNLEKIIPWEAMDIELIGTAGNGAAALVLAAERKPDLILTDIRMPVMDGITLLRELRASFYEGEIIMLTGFQEFEYARSAVKYGARDYILKPIDYEELQRVIERLAEDIRGHKARKLKESAQWKELSELASEKIMLDLLMDYQSVHFYRLQEDAGWEWLDRRFHLLLVDVDDYSLLARQSERERKLAHFAVRNVLQEALLAECPDYAVLQTREGEWCLPMPVPADGGEGVSEPVLRSRSAQVQQALERFVKLSVSVGVYPEAVAAEQLASVYKKVQRELQLSLHTRHVLLVGEEPGGTETGGRSFWPLADGFAAALTQGDAVKLAQAQEELARTLREARQQGSMRAEQQLHFLNLHLLREMRSAGLLGSEQEQAMWEQLEASHSVKELVACVQLLIRECTPSGGSRRKTPELLMASAKDYIHKHLSSDLGVDEVAQHLGISCSYFSLLFKQQFQETFLEYVTRERMELARTLLLTGDKSVTQIGKQTGYADRRYFTKVFHKVFGMTPSEYRERQKPSSASVTAQSADDAEQ